MDDRQTATMHEWLRNTFGGKGHNVEWMIDIRDACCARMVVGTLEHDGALALEP